MAIPHETVPQLQNEGIDSPDDLVDFDKDTLKEVAENLRKPSDRIPNPDPNAPAGSTIPGPAHVFGAKSQKRLNEACELVHFYETIRRSLAAGNIRHNPTIEDFTQQWKALKDRKDNEDADVPKISKALPLLKWTEAFGDCSSRTKRISCDPLFPCCQRGRRGTCSCATSHGQQTSLQRVWICGSRPGPCGFA